MKKILLEMERLRNLNSGLGQFCWHLGQEIGLQSTKKEIELTFYVPDNQGFMFGERAKYQTVSKWHKIFSFPQNYAIWHCLHQDSNYLPSDQKTKLILTIHDLNFMERKDYSTFRKRLKINRLQKKINRSSAIIYISEFTKRQVHQHLIIPKEIIEKVIYLGISLTQNSDDKHDISRLKDKFSTKKFIFSIGIIQPKKNFHVILPILQHRKDLIWVLAGDDSTDYAQQIRQIAIEMNVSEQVCFLGKVQESEKYWLYENCEAFIFPSLAEGFGLPVVEAMSLGKPVFLSRLTSLPEVGGKEAYYFDDFSAKNITEVFENGMNDFKNDPRKSSRIKQWAAQFDWKSTAKAYLELYESL